jgi:hypothetical protein
MEKMKETYDLVGRDSYPMVRQDRLGNNVGVDYLDTFRFVPKSTLVHN